MKKYVYLIVFMLGLGWANTSFATGKIGVSLAAGVFETSGKENENSTDTTEDATVDTSASKSAEGLFGIGSLFFEKALSNENISLGIDYVPFALSSETSEHKQSERSLTANSSSTVTNKVQVDFEDLLTLYAKVDFNNNFYGKVGYMQVEAVTNESLGTGGAYGDETLTGYTLGIGYETDLDNGAFVRLEGNWMQIGGETFTNTVNTSTNVVVDDIDGYGARLSIGRSF